MRGVSLSRHQRFGVVAATLVGAFAVTSVLSGQAPVQVLAPAPTTVAPAVPAVQAPVSVAEETDGGRLRLVAGRSLVLSTPFNIRRLSLTNAVVADATAVSPRELLIDGKTAGTISLIVWGETTRVHYELVVEPAVTTLEQRMHELFPGRTSASP